MLRKWGTGTPSPAGGAGLMAASTVAQSHHSGTGMTRLWRDSERTSGYLEIFTCHENGGRGTPIPSRRCWPEGGEYSGLRGPAATGMVLLWQGWKMTF